MIWPDDNPEPVVQRVRGNFVGYAGALRGFVDRLWRREAGDYRELKRRHKALTNECHQTENCQHGNGGV